MQASDTGAAAENLAERFLQSQGLTCVARNYRTRFGEIDLVMHDRDTLVFVEVRHRSSGKFGGAASSIHDGKRRRIAAAAEHYLLTLHTTPPCRFDVVLMERLSMDAIEWIRDAFRV